MVRRTTGFTVYARVSAADQNRELELDALKPSGCTRVLTDYASGSKTPCPQLDRALDQVFRMFSTLAEVERDLIRERTQAGSDINLWAASSA